MKQVNKRNSYQGVGLAELRLLCSLKQQRQQTPQRHLLANIHTIRSSKLSRLFGVVLGVISGNRKQFFEPQKSQTKAEVIQRDAGLGFFLTTARIGQINKIYPCIIHRHTRSQTREIEKRERES